MKPSEALHDSAIVVDGHVHITNAVFVQGIDPWQPQPTGTFDYARARQGGLNVVIEHLFVEDSYTDANETLRQAFRLIETFYRVLDANPERMALALTANEAREIVAGGRLAVILALEGGIDPAGDLNVLRLMHRLGVRMIQLTNHDTTNAMVDAYAGEQRWGGLSDHGRVVIAEMNRLGIVIDISHAPDHAKQQVITASRAPVVTSHNGLAQFAQVIGNLSDDTLTWLADRGGLVGLHSAGWLIKQSAADWTERQSGPTRRAAPTSRTAALDDRGRVTALDAEMRDRWLHRWGYGRPWREAHDEAVAGGAPLPTVEEWAEQIAWIVATVGADHAALGLDLMAGGNWLRDFDATGYGRLTTALVACGLDEAAVRKVLGENWLRIIDAARVT